MLFNDLLILESLVIFSLLFYTLNTNILMLLYTGFIFLTTTGLIALINDGDIYIGFLWLIDLGVGLVFFIFILHFSSFLSHKSIINLTLRFRLIIFSFFLFSLLFLYTIPFYSTQSYTNYNYLKSWFYRVSFLDYYKIYSTSEITDLQTLKNSYFFSNSYEFFLINFSILFSILSAILLFFLIKRIFVFLNFNYLLNNQLVNKVNTNFFIRNQNFVKQQNTQMNVLLWTKKK